MGLDLNAAKFLFWAKNLGVSFERTLTLGHQGFFCSPAQLKRAVRDFGIPGTQEEINRCFTRPSMGALYADEFFRFLGAKETASVDRSDFEDATLLHDLNDRFPENVRGHFDMVVDGGTLEHIFDFPGALRNCLELLRVGGHFVAFTPASGHMGHGFYQFSPELFYRVFCEENGYAVRKMILHNCLLREAPFYEVKDPAVTGLRSELFSAKPLLMSVLAQKIADVPVFAKTPQQSDYAASWEDHQNTNAPGKAVVPSGKFQELRVKLNPHWPHWLRQSRDIWRHWKGLWQHGRPNLNNRRHYRKLNWEEITGERALTK